MSNVPWRWDWWMHSQKNHIAFKNYGVYKPSTNGKLGQGKSIHVAAMFPTIFPPLRTRNHCMLMPRSMCSSGWTISNLVILASIRRSRRVAFPLSKFCWCLPRTKKYQEERWLLAGTEWIILFCWSQADNAPMFPALYSVPSFKQDIYVIQKHSLI